MGEYKKNHVVTAGYLRRFSDDRGLVQPVRLGKQAEEIVRPQRPATLGHRPHFFADRDVAKFAERRLNAYETRGLKALNLVKSRWPVEDDLRYSDRLDIACLVAIHMVRTPIFRDYIAHLKIPMLGPTAAEHGLGEEAADQFVRAVTSPAFTADHILGLVPKMASMIASAHWTLVEFPAALLATSDQPVTVVPILPDGMQAPVQARPSGGYAFTEEIRFPVDPSHALLFTWLNQPDTPGVLRGTDDLAAEFNRTVIAQADREWFHHPARRPTCLESDGLRAEGCFPVGRVLLPGYGAAIAVGSRRRINAFECLNRMIEQEVTDSFHVARVKAA